MQNEPIATYRLQLRPEFGFKEANDILPYLSNLGISHIYASPHLQAVLNSTHGYDIVDPTKINAQLGNNDSHKSFCENIKALGLQLMVDVVPNHMAIEGKQNPWWWDVLENGACSLYAAYFDVDWAASKERWPNKVLLPLLENHYGRVLESGALQLTFQEGRMVLRYQNHIFPIDPSSLSNFFNQVANLCNSEFLSFIAESYARLPRTTATSKKAIEQRHRDKTVLTNLLERLCREEPSSVAAINIEIKRLNQDADALDKLLDEQNYRLAFWRVGNHDLGYRRFFDIKELVGVRVEDLKVFYATHSLLISWFSKGWLQGLRIDHPDGLKDPEQYFKRLQKAFPGVWIVAEKILVPGEQLPSTWKIGGTTGYDFLNLVSSLFIDSGNEVAMTNTYEKFTGEAHNFKELVYECKLLVLIDLFSSELNQLTNLFIEVCEKHRRHRDYSHSELNEALKQTAACFPVYRSYVSAWENFVTVEDEKKIEEAIELATNKNPDLDPELFIFLRNLLLLQYPGTLEGEFAMRFQQLTGPAMAKGFEDTALYRYNRLIALNEVGGDPTRFGISPKKFHEACSAAQKNYPFSLLATATHDTKHGEDFRTRLVLLSEIPKQFEEAVLRWMAINEKYRNNAVGRNIEYHIYQILIGAWPIDQERFIMYLKKAIREAKENTSWTKPNKDYENSVCKFATSIMQDNTFRADIENFINPLVLPGMINSLSQTLIKLTAPGVPDIYQGREIWDFSLVDPDNRRLVDFSMRNKLLKKINERSPKEILAGMEEGIPKLWIIYKTLQIRKTSPQFFGPNADYEALYPQGSKSEYALSFRRGKDALILVPRLILGLNNDWVDTCLEMPKGIWYNVFTGTKVLGGKKIMLKELLGNFPVALFTKQNERGLYE